MSDLPKQGEEVYIGDGLYASFDGYQIVLRTTRLEGDHYVALEPRTYQNLQTWIEAHRRLKEYMGA